jgi:hypothetical protein
MLPLSLAMWTRSLQENQRYLRHLIGDRVILCVAQWITAAVRRPIWWRGTAARNSS